MVASLGDAMVEFGKDKHATGTDIFNGKMTFFIVVATAQATALGRSDSVVHPALEHKKGDGWVATQVILTHAPHSGHKMHPYLGFISENNADLGGVLDPVPGFVDQDMGIVDLVYNCPPGLIPFAQEIEQDATFLQIFQRISDNNRGSGGFIPPFHGDPSCFGGVAMFYIHNVYYKTKCLEK